MSASVDLFVCLFVCPQTYLRNYTSDLYLISLACHLWLWLRPSLAALRYLAYFRFYGRRHICTQWAIRRHVDTVATSDVIASSCAHQRLAACIVLDIRCVVDDGERRD